MSYLMNSSEILQTIQMIDQQHLDVRTVTMGISLLDCAAATVAGCAEKIYDKLCRTAEQLVPVSCTIEQEYGIPIVNKRVSVTPIALVAAACGEEDYAPIAKALDRAATQLGINFIGGFSALAQKGFTESDLKLVRSMPEALTETELVCGSVNVGSTRAGINMDAVAMMGRIIRDPHRVEGDIESLPGLGLIPTVTEILPEKVTRQVRFSLASGSGPMEGYEIHMGDTFPMDAVVPSPLNVLENGQQDGFLADSKCMGTYIHGILDNPGFVDFLLAPHSAKLEKAAEEFDYKSFKEKQYDLLADHVRKYVDVPLLYDILKGKR